MTVDGPADVYRVVWTAFAADRFANWSVYVDAHETTIRLPALPDSLAAVLGLGRPQMQPDLIEADDYDAISGLDAALHGYGLIAPYRPLWTQRMSRFGTLFQMLPTGHSSRRPLQPDGNGSPAH